MNSALLEKLLYLIIGGVSGSLVTGFIMKSKYENSKDEEIEEIRQAMLEGIGKDERKNDEHDDDADDDAVEDIETLKKISSNKVNQVKQAREKPDMKNILEKNGYREEPDFDDEDDDDEFEEEELDDSELPFSEETDIAIITEEEFGEYRDYEKQYLFYLRDKTLVDDQGNMIDDVDEYVGFDSIHQFNEYDDNHVYVRNYRLKTDFDIYRDTEHTYKNFKER